MHRQLLLASVLALPIAAMPALAQDAQGDAKQGGSMIVAMADPTNVFALDDLRLVTGRDIRVVVASPEQIDIVISRGLALTGQWKALHGEIRAFRKACGRAHMKTILATGELGTLANVARASLVCMMAGADFIKTSTGKEPVNATLPVGLVMVRAIRDYLERTGYRVGFKPAGGIRTAKDSLDWLAMMKDELGEPWLRPELFRFGASGLLADIERQLEFFVTGRYSAFHRHPLA